MSATPTPGEAELDNSSSINNISSLLAEQGTGTGTAGTTDEEIETSSIEALNWSEADEEELQLQQKIAAASGSHIVTKTKSSSQRQKAAEQNSKQEVLKVENKDIESNTGRMLSSSLLQSISSISDSDESTKKSVIENWASSVKEAVERGEMEIAEESGEDDDEEEDEDDNMTSKCDEGNNENTGMRKRIKLTLAEGPMSMSSISSFTVDSITDPLSNAPVLDDGPIWNKGPKRYRFQENRRINQKLTFGVLLAVVLAIGLGLGNLVAFNECETEYKASQVNSKPEGASLTAESSIGNDKSPSDQEKSANAITDNDAATVTSSQKEMPMDEKVKIVETTMDDKTLLENKMSKKVSNNIIKEEEPKVDPRYALHMETLSKIVKTLDNLQRKIDKFENTSRQLGGVIMLKDSEDDDEAKPEVMSSRPESEQENESLSFFDEQVHEEEEETEQDDDDDLIRDTESFEDISILSLIDGIEETIDYLRRQDEIKFAKKYEQNKHKSRKNMFNPVSEEEEELMLLIKARVEATADAQEDFIRKERDELRERKILGLAEERNPEDYSLEERAEIQKKYNKFIEEYPMEEEVEKIMKRIKQDNENSPSIKDEHIEDDFIEEFFDNHNTARSGSVGDSGDGEDWISYGYDDYDEVGNLKKADEMDLTLSITESNKIEPTKHDKDDKQTKNQLEPKKSLIESSFEAQEQSIMDFEPIKTDKVISPSKDNRDNINTFSKGDEEEVENKRIKRGKSPKKEYSKNKSEKQSKKSKSRDDFEGSGQKPPKKDYYEKKYSNNKKKKDKQGEDNNQHQKHKKFVNKPNGENKDPKNDYDFDDDDDHKRRKYLSNSNKENNGQDQFLNRKHTKEQDSNWLLERTKVREDIRRDSGNLPELNQHHSTGKKGNNWQMERDRVREKFRSKSHKNKSYDN